MSRISVSRPLVATRSMRSWDSDSMISYGVMPVSRWGTRDSSTSMPVPARAGISEHAHARPAAPMSWMPTMAPVAIASRHASVLPHEPDRHGVHQRVARVLGSEASLPAQVGDAKAVAVPADARDDALD